MIEGSKEDSIFSGALNRIISVIPIKLNPMLYFGVYGVMKSDRLSPIMGWWIADIVSQCSRMCK